MPRTVVAAFCLCLATAAFAQTPGDADLNRGYKALAAKDYDTAIAVFQQGLTLQPGNAKAHKDLAYTLLKTGDNSEARDQFKQALDLESKDETAALEFAFLAYETKQPIAARRTCSFANRTQSSGGVLLIKKGAICRYSHPIVGNENWNSGSS